MLRISASLAIVLATASSGAAQKSVRLSRLEARGTGTPSGPCFSPDGSTLFFGYDAFSDGVSQLFSARVDGVVEPVVVSPDGFQRLEFSPDGRWVAYLSDALRVRAASADGPGRSVPSDLPLVASFSFPLALTPDSTRLVYRHGGLRCGPLDGSAPPLALAPSTPSAILVTPDSTRAVYESGGWHSVLLDGSTAPVQLTPPLATLEVELSPDSGWLVYAVGRATGVSFPTEVFAVPIAGGPAVQLTLPLDPDQRVIASHAVVGTRLVYRVASYTLSPTGAELSAVELRSAPLDGGAGGVLVTPPTRIVDGPAAGADGWLVYRALSGSPGFAELFRQRADGSGAPKVLNAPLVSGGAVTAFSLTPDGRRVLYVAAQDVLDRRELYVVPIDGTAVPLRLSTPDPTGSVFQQAPLVSPGGRRVVYAVREHASGDETLCSAPLDGGTPARELARVPHPGSLTGQVITPDGQRVLFLARFDPDPGFALYGVAIEGGTSPARLSAPLAPGAFIGAVVPSPRGDHVAYLTDEGGGRRSLYLVRTDGSEDAVRVDRLPAPLAGDVDDHGARGGRAVYRADAGDDGVVELFAAPLDGRHGPKRVNGVLAPGGDVAEWLFTPDGGRVVYRAEQSAAGRNELFVCTLAGRGAAQRVHPALAAGRNVESFALDAAGTAVVYRADQDVNDRVELYRAPLDGSGTSARLNAALVPGGRVLAFALDPLGERVAYLADQTTFGTFELHGRPLDRSAAAVRLSPVLVPGGDVLDVALDALGLRAVYRADQGADEVVELHSVPLDASGPAVRISAALGPGGDVLDYALDPLGVFAVYRADGERDGVDELYVAPLDGSSPARRLNPSLAPAGDVLARGYAIDPAGRRACFVVDELGNGELALYAAPLDGSAVAVRLDPPAAGQLLGGVPPPFRIDPAGASAHFLSRATGAPEAALWRAPLDGSSAAVPITPPDADVRGLPEFSGDVLFYATREAVFRVPLAGGSAVRVTPLASLGSVRDFRVLPGFVVHRADHAVPGVIDLWASPLASQMRSAAR